MILELSDNFSNIAIILSNSFRWAVNSNFIVRLFHPPQFIMTPLPIYIFQKFSNPPTIEAPYDYVGRV